MPGTWGETREGADGEGSPGPGPPAPSPGPPYFGAGLDVVLHHGHPGHGEERLGHLEGQRPEPGACGAERGSAGRGAGEHPSGPAHSPFCGPPMRITAFSAIAAPLRPPPLPHTCL